MDTRTRGYVVKRGSASTEIEPGFFAPRAALRHGDGRAATQWLGGRGSDGARRARGAGGERRSARLRRGELCEVVAAEQHEQLIRMNKLPG